MKVYVLEEGEYDHHGWSDVFDTPERAMGSHPGPWVLTFWNREAWRLGYFKTWSCECRKNCTYEFSEVELNTAGRLGSLDRIVEQRPAADGGWDYVTIDDSRAAELEKRAATH